MNDISNKEDVKLFVDAFYTKVREDDLIGPVFASKIAADKWGPHLERMYSFWNTVLFSVRDYSGNPFSKHADLPVKEAHFTRWIDLFTEIIDANFKGEVAEDAKSRATKMGYLFQKKIEYIQSNDNYKNIM